MISEKAFSGVVFRTESIPDGSRALAQGLIEDSRLYIERNAFEHINKERSTISTGWIDWRNCERKASEWVKKLDLLDSLTDVILLMGIRMDEIKLNAAVLKANIDLACIKASAKKGGVRISRAERLAIEEQERKKMIDATSPVTTIHEIAWVMDHGIILSTGKGDSHVEAISEIIRETFLGHFIDHELVIQTPFTVCDCPEQVTPIVFSPWQQVLETREVA